MEAYFGMSLSNIDCVNGANFGDWHENALQTRENPNRFCEWNRKVEWEKKRTRIHDSKIWFASYSAIVNFMQMIRLTHTIRCTKLNYHYLLSLHLLNQLSTICIFCAWISRGKFQIEKKKRAKNVERERESFLSVSDKIILISTFPFRSLRKEKNKCWVIEKNNKLLMKHELVVV